MHQYIFLQPYAAHSMFLRRGCPDAFSRAREVAEREGRGETDDRAGGLRGAERRRGGVRIHREEAALSGRAPADHRGERERVTGMVRWWARTRMASRVARAGEYRDQTFRRGTHAPFRPSPLRACASPGFAVIGILEERQQEIGEKRGGRSDCPT